MGKSISKLTRWDLARLFTGTGVEVGVERGKYSRAICKSNPGVKLFGVDPWKAEHNDKKDYTQETIDGFREITIARTKGCDFTPIQKFSVDAAKDFENNSLDFVYLDGAHDYQSVVDDLNAWYPKVKTGGILSGHDYATINTFGVIEAVDEFADSHSLDLIIWGGNVHTPSWSLFKQ